MSILTIAQIIISIALITLILIQERSAGMGAFGGGGGGEGSGFYQKRRGMEKTLYIITIVLIVLFAGLSLVNLLVV
jgi:preprotein translocase subunit SecG